jgi:hypothetical protein
MMVEAGLLGDHSTALGSGVRAARRLLLLLALLAGQSCSAASDPAEVQRSSEAPAKERADVPSTMVADEKMRVGAAEYAPGTATTAQKEATGEPPTITPRPERDGEPSAGSAKTPSHHEHERALPAKRRAKKSPPRTARSVRPSRSAAALEEKRSSRPDEWMLEDLRDSATVGGSASSAVGSSGIDLERERDEPRAVVSRRANDRGSEAQRARRPDRDVAEIREPVEAAPASPDEIAASPDVVPAAPAAEPPPPAMPAAAAPGSSQSEEATGSSVTAEPATLRTSSMPSETQGPQSYWNTWVTLATQIDSDPVAKLVPDVTYRLHLDLARLRYEHAQVHAADPSPSVREALKGTNPFEFEIVIFPDPDVFVKPKGTLWVRSMPVDPARPSTTEAPSSMKTPPRGQNASRDHELGYVSFELKTRRNVQKPMWGSVAISIWSNGRPVEELVTRHCVSPLVLEECATVDGDDDAETSSSGTNAIEAATRQRDVPDAGIHLVAVGDDSMWGIFRRRDQKLKDAVKWELDSAKTIRTNVATVLSSFVPGRDVGGLGRDLLSTLFPASSAARKARQALEALVRKPPDQGNHVLVVRSLPALAFPMALGTIDNKAIGNAFFVEQPLEGVDGAPAAPENPCPMDWIGLRPAPENVVRTILDGTLHKARNRLDGYSDPMLVNLRAQAQHNFFDINAFASWMRAADDEGPPKRVGLVLLSHHGEADHLSFGPLDRIPAASFVRPFARSSFAILNACGTGSPTAMGFVSALERENVSSIVATATEMQASMAVDFLHCFAQEQGKLVSAAPIREVFKLAQECLRSLEERAGNGPYGDSVFAYMLLGDPNVPVCPLESLPEQKP